MSLSTPPPPHTHTYTHSPPPHTLGTSHYGFHIVLWHIPLAVSGQVWDGVTGSLSFNPRPPSSATASATGDYSLPFFVPGGSGTLFTTTTTTATATTTGGTTGTAAAPATATTASGTSGVGTATTTATQVTLMVQQGTVALHSLSVAGSSPPASQLPAVLHAGGFMTWQLQ